MPLIREDVRGVFVVAATPFADDLSVDLEGIGHLADRYRHYGADGLTILGMMGEATKLSTEESRSVMQAFIRHAGDLPVVVGVSAPGLAAMAEQTRYAMEQGAAGVMVAPPATVRTDEQILAYFQMVAEVFGKDVPIILQDFPLVTTVQISSRLLGQIIDSIPQVKALKHEDWPGLAKIDALRSAQAKGQRRIGILTGNGGIMLLEEMLRGADGAMTGFAYPEMMRDVIGLVGTDEVEKARDLFDAYLPLIRYEQQPALGLAVRKYVMKKRGMIATDKLRRPGPALSANDAADIDAMMERLARRLADLGI